MATPSPTFLEQVRDPGYINWLKVGLALNLMKTGLHEFILTETGSMHQSIIKKLYEGPTVPFSPCDKCYSSDIKLYKSVWKFVRPCPSSMCDKWMSELLSTHQEPFSNKICWDNSNVSAWPFNPWECAKIFMPRGQPRTNTGPSQSDVPALMSLMRYCTHFSSRLSLMGVQLTKEVSLIRNALMHASDMKFSESKMKDSMHKIIQLLEDHNHLKSLTRCIDAVSEIKKILDLPVQVFFNIDLGAEVLGSTNAIQALEAIDCKAHYIISRLDKQEQMVLRLEQLMLGIDDRIKEANEVRKESQELRDLKRSTENLLDSFRKMDFVLTEQVKAASLQLQNHNYVTLQGNPGEGKTTTAFHLMDKFGVSGRRVIIRLPSEWKLIDIDLVDLVILEDMFGRFDLDINRLQEWYAFLEDIVRHLDAGKLKVIITTRVCILYEALSNLKVFMLFDSDQLQTLSSKNLERSEMLRFLEKELKRKSRDMNDKLKLKCVKNFKGLIGFPQCCSLFAGEKYLFARGPEFFKRPEEFFTRNIKTYIGPRLLLFAFLFCNNGSFPEEIVLTSTMPETNKQKLNDIARALDVPEGTSPLALIRNEIDHYSGTYTERSGPHVMFTHTTIYEAVGNVLGEQAKDIVIKYCSSDFLFQRLCTGDVGCSTRNQIYIPNFLHKLLAERIIEEVINRNHCERVANTSFIRDRQFVITLTEHLRDPPYGTSFLRKRDCIPTKTSNKSQHGHCSNFLQYVLKRDPRTVDVVFEHFLDFLSCSCGQIFSCWKCHEKQYLLELSMYYGHFDIADKLLERNTQVNPVCLCNAARHDKPEKIQFIIETLKEGGNFDRLNELTEESLCVAFVTGNTSVIDCLVEEGILLGHNSLKSVVRKGNLSAYLKVLRHLKSVGNWQPNEESERKDIGRSKLNKALCIAYMEEKFDIATMLVAEGIPMYMGMLPKLVNNCSYKVVVRLVDHLKECNVWDPKSIEAAETMEIFSSGCNDDRKKKLFHFLVQQGIIPILKNVAFVVKHDPEYTDELIKNLKAQCKWNSQVDPASEALKEAIIGQKDSIFDLLIREGVSLTMQNLPDVVKEAQDKVIDMAINHLKNNKRWNPKSVGVSRALEWAFVLEKNDICHRLIREGIILQLENLSSIVLLTESSTVIKKVVRHLKDNNAWSSQSDLVSKALEWAHVQEKHEVCDALIQEGVTLTMQSIPNIVRKARSGNAIFNVIKYLKENNEWNNQTHNASEALREAIVQEKYYISGPLIQEGVILTMKDFPYIVMLASDNAIIETMHHLKEKNEWQSQSIDASEALKSAFLGDKRDLCKQLIQDRVPLTIKNLHDSLRVASDRALIEMTKYLKMENKWNPHVKSASEILLHAFIHEKHDFLKFLIYAERVSLTMDILPEVVINSTYNVIVTVIAHIKDIGNWNIHSYRASKALEEAIANAKHDIYYLLINEGLWLTMENLLNIVKNTSDSIVFQAVEHLKSHNKWNPESEDARKAHDYAYDCRRENVCEYFYNNGMKKKKKKSFRHRQM